MTTRAMTLLLAGQKLKVECRSSFVESATAGGKALRRTGSSPCAGLGRFIVSLPSPYQSVLWVNNLSDPLETTFGQNARRGVGLRKRVCSNHANLPVAESEAHQRPGSLGRVTFALVFWIHSISNLYHTI